MIENMTEEDVKAQNAEATERYVKMCTDGGLSATDARLVADIAVHAVIQAQQTMARVISSGPTTDIQGFAMAIALIAMEEVCVGLQYRQLQVALKRGMH